MLPISASRLAELAILTLSVTALACAPTLVRAEKRVTPAAVPAFTVRAIGPPFFSDAYLPIGVNDAGMVAGTNVSATPDTGFFFSRGNVHAMAPPPHMAGSEIFGINNSGLIAAQGCFTSACGTTRAFTGKISHGSAVWKQLPAPNGSSFCTVQGCTSAADGIGQTGDLTGQFGSQAIMWLPKSHGTYASKRLAYTDATRFNRSSGLAVDGFGDVAGFEGSGFATVGVFWPSHGSPLMLPGCQNVLVRGGATFEYPYAVAATGTTSKRTINVAGKCLVKAPTSNQLGFAPCSWRVTINGSSAKISAPVRLDANDGSDNGRAAAINHMGWIAGNQGDAGSSPTLWIKQQPHLLNSLIPANSGWTIDAVYAMNNKGQITGIGTDQGGTRAFLLTPKG
jgi:hypothetical protein